MVRSAGVLPQVNAEDKRRSERVKDLISLADIASILRLAPQQIHTLIEEHRFLVIIGRKDKPHITQKDFDTLAFSEPVTQAKLEALRRVAIRRTLDERGENKVFSA